MSAEPSMTDEKRLESLKLGDFDWRWAGIFSVAAILFAWGVFAYSEQARHGLIVTGLRSIGQGGAAWGVYVMFDVYFVGVSFAGITIAAMVRLFPLHSLRSLSRLAELLTITALLLGSLSIVADLGRPLHGLWNLPRFARPSSPFFGTFTLVVAGYLFASVVYFFVSGRSDAALCASRPSKLRFFYRVWATGYQGTGEEVRRHSHSTFWLALSVLPLLVAAHSTLGFVFGIQAGRPGWFSALQAPGFVVLAAASGLSMLLAIAAGLRWLLSLEHEIETDAFRLLGNFIWITIMVYLYFMAVEELTATYAAPARDVHVAHAVTLGRYGGLFWTTVVCFVAPAAFFFGQFITGKVHIAWSAVAGLVVNVGAILKRFLIVVPSQTEGLLIPYPVGHYTPSWVEISVIVGLFGLGALVILLFAKIFPIVPIVKERVVVGHSEERRLDKFSLATLATGIALAVLGLALSLRIGTLPHLDPVVPFSPVIFAFGVMLSFASAIVYECLPALRRPPKVAD